MSCMENSRLNTHRLLFFTQISNATVFQMMLNSFTIAQMYFTVEYVNVTVRVSNRIDIMVFFRSVAVLSLQSTSTAHFRYNLKISNPTELNLLFGYGAHGRNGSFVSAQSFIAIGDVGILILPSVQWSLAWTAF